MTYRPAPSDANGTMARRDESPITYLTAVCEPTAKVLLCVPCANLPIRIARTAKSDGGQSGILTSIDISQLSWKADTMESLMSLRIVVHLPRGGTA